MLGIESAAGSTRLLDPVVAPQGLLDRVSQEPTIQKLVADTSIGKVKLELYSSNGSVPIPSGENDRFVGAHHVSIWESDPVEDDFDWGDDSGETELSGASEQPGVELPYAILSDGSSYMISITAPREAALSDWSEPIETDLSSGMKLGMSSGQFRSMWPGVNDGLVDGNYRITAEVRERDALMLAARVEGGEPLARRQRINVTGFGAIYEEVYTGDFAESERDPALAVATISNRLTATDTGHGADVQPLIFKDDDGYQRAHESDPSKGMLEVIVFSGRVATFNNFIFKPVVYGLSDLGTKSFGGSSGMYGSATRGLSSIRPGETRFGAPQRVDVSTQLVDGVPEPIAAFQVALVSAL